MNKTRTKTIVVAFSLLALVLSMQAVYAAPIGTNLLVDTNGADGWNIQIHGSSTVFPITRDCKPFYEARFTGNTITTTGLGSGDGLNKLRDGLTDIAQSSKIPEKATYFDVIPDLRIWVVGMDSVAIIVPASNTWLTNVASAQVIADIFRASSQLGGVAQYANWNDVPGLQGIPGVPSTPINRYTRNLDDGTHDCFNTFFMKAYGYDTGTTPGTGKWLPSSTVQKDTNPLLLAAIAADPNGIGYVGMGFLPANEGTLNGVSINGVSPTTAHVLDGTYQGNAGAIIRRFLWYCTNGIPNKNQPGAMKSQYISFARMDNDYLTDNGYITVLKGDFTCSASTQIQTTGDTNGPIHPALPDYRVNFDDILYFVDSYIAAGGASGLADPYCDFDADLDVDFDDILAFVDVYIASPH